MGVVVLERFEVREILGEGHFGRVHRAFDRVLKKEVALKEFFPDPSDSGGESSKREMEFLAHLSHPALVRVHDFLIDESSGTHYLTQDLVRGERLSDFLLAADWEARLNVFIQLLHGLEYLHQRGVIHLDIKPSNVLVSIPTAPGLPEARILDFGVAERMDPTRRRALITGTFPYVAPEVVRGDPVDGRADLYSLARIYFESLRPRPLPAGDGASDPAGRDGDDLEAMIRETLRRKAPELEDFPEEIPLYFREILVSLLQPNPRGRFWSANEVVRRINMRTGLAFPLEPGRVRLPDKTSAILAGRTAEFETLCRWFEQHLQGARALSFAAVFGKPETGKSALLDEFRRWAELREMEVISLQHPDDGVGDLFRRAAKDSDLESLRPFAPFLKNVLPGPFGNAPDPPVIEASPDLQQARAFDKWTEALRVLLDRRPVAILVDDAHLKPPLADLLLRLVHRLRAPGGISDVPGPAKTFISVHPHPDPPPSRGREKEGEARSFLSLPPLRGKVRMGGAERLQTFILFTAAAEGFIPPQAAPDWSLGLAAWTKGQATGVLLRLLGVDTVPEYLLERLVGATEGVPGLFVECVRRMASDVLQPGENMEAQLDALDPSRVDGILDAGAWYGGEIKALPGSEQDVLAWLAVAAAELRSEDLERLEPSVAGSSVALLRRLESLGWVRSGLHGYQLAGDLRRAAVDRALEPGRRQEMHFQIARRWRELSLHHARTGLGHDGAALAQAGHCFRAGRAETAFEIAAPELALRLRLHQPEPVLRFLEEHREAAGRLPPDPGRMYRKLLAEASFLTSNFAAAAATYRDFASQGLTPEERAECTAGLARSLRFGGKLAEAAEVIERSGSEIRGDSPWRPELDALYADILLEQARYPEAAAVCRPYLDGGRPCGPDEILAFRHVLAKTHFYRRETEQAIALFKQNSQESRRSGRLARHALSLNSLGAAYLLAGATDAAVESLHACSVLSQEIGDLRGMALAHVNLGVSYQKTGRSELSAEHYEKALAISRGIGARTEVARILYNLGMLRCAVGDLEGGEDALAEAASLCSELGMSHLEAKVCFERAGGLLRRGDRARARAECEKGEALYEKLRMPTELLEMRLKRAQVELEDGRGDEATKIIETAGEEASKSPTPWLQARILYLKARLAGRRIDVARDLLERSMVKLESSDRKDEDLKRLVMEELGRLSSPGGASREPPEAGGAAPEPTGERRAGGPESEEHGETTRIPLQRRRADTLGLTLLEIARKISSPLNAEGVLVEIVDSLLAFTEADRGFLLLMEKGHLDVRVARSRDRKDILDPAEKFSLTVAEEALKERQPVVSMDAASDPRFKDSASIYQLQLRSVVGIPFFVGREPLGALYLDTQEGEGRFGEADFPLLSSLGELAAVAIHKADLTAQHIRDQRELRKTVRELREAKNRVDDLARSLEDSNRKLEDKVATQEGELEEARVRLTALIHQEQPKYGYDRIIGSSRALRDVLLMVDRAVESRVPVLIEGESGTGKELVARAIHFNSSRKEKPFVPINCGAVPYDLFESELFGHVKGAFTGADRDKPGLIEVAAGGTLFLDEIGEMPLGLQVKMLRVLQESAVRRIGGVAEVPVDVRIVAASNRDLKTLVSEKKVREDFYYRLSVYRITVPPLGRRKEDIPPLAEHFLKRIAEEEGRPVKSISQQALSLLAGFHWPGNVRELENAVRNAAVACRSNRIDVQDLRHKPELFGESALISASGNRRLRDLLREVQKKAIVEALRRRDGNITLAAQDLGVGRSLLSLWVKKFRLKSKAAAERTG
ncbi:MAG: sigma 54-interacting transcriptional regulator [Nitrospirae bacterium]|nr:sigma 54-interacting transcriptional regulator [Nitrospirota bacterium]